MNETPNNNTEQNPSNNIWTETMQDVPPLGEEMNAHSAEIEPSIDTPEAPESANETQDNKSPEREKTFTDSELERIAKLTGRMPDDPEVIKLNLVLRAEKFQQLGSMIKNMQASNTMIQQGTLEDFATAKRELEAAAYLFDGRFKDLDDKLEALNEAEKRENMKDSVNSKKHNGEGVATSGNSWVRARIERQERYNNKREGIATTKENLVIELDDRLRGKKFEDFKNSSEIYQTYNLHKDESPEEPISNRRNGTDGIYDENNKIDLWFNPKPDANPAEQNTDKNTDKNTDNKINEDENIDEAEDPEEVPEEPPTDEEEFDPLVAINADFTRDRQDLARHYAKAELETENAKSNFFKQLWRGTLFKKYYEKKYEREILEGDRMIHVGDEQTDLDDLISRRSDSAIKRFVLGVIDDPETSAFIHRDIGGKGQGESLSEADQELTAAIRTEIEKFASAEIPEGGNLDDLRLEFGNAIRRIQAERRDAGEDVNQKLINNYYEVALQARERVEHGIAIENVMEGFKVYNAEVRNNQRTEEHRDKIDSLINKLESGRLGQLLPAEVIAGVVGGAFALAQTGAQTAARATGLAGGFVVSGIFAGLKERNRVTEDRARMMRDAAVGLQYSGTSGEDLEEMTRSERARAKYEARLGGTLYDLRPANELVEGINQAVESGDKEAIIRAIAEARVRINFSDSEQKDLIAYSSADQMGDERTNLDIAVIDAERNLSEEDRAELENMFNVVTREINESVDEKDVDFRKVRTAQALRQAGKTMAIGALTFFASQEIIAAISPDKVGLLEKVGILKTQNNENASETLLAGLAGPRSTRTIEVANISGDRTEDIEALKEQGYTQVEVSNGHAEFEQSVAEVPIRDSASAVNVEVDYLNNGTTVSDGLELRLYNDANGNFVAGMNGGTSTMNGEVFNFDRYASAGQIKGLMNIGGANVFIEPTINDAGQITFLVDANGNMTTTAGELVKAIGNNGEELFKTLSVVADVGENADGVTRVLSWATEVGNNTSDGTMMSVVNNIVEKAPVYDFVKNVTNEVFLGGVGIGVANRVSLGESRPGRATETAPPPEAPAEENPPETPEEVPTVEEDDQRIEELGATDYIDSISNLEHVDELGREGKIILVTEEDLPAERIANWWNGLNDGAKAEVASFVNSYGDSTPRGRALKAWLAQNQNS